MSGDSSFFTATAYRYRLEAFSGSLSHTNNSPTTASLYFFIHGSLKYNNSFRKLFHGGYFLHTFLSPALACLSLRTKTDTLLQVLCCKIFVLKYLRRTSTLRKFYNTKFCPMKNSYNPNLRYSSLVNNAWERSQG